MEKTMKHDPNYYKKIIIALCLGWVAIWIYRTILTPIYPQIQESLGNISDTQMGLVASIYFFAYTGMQIPSGALVDKFGQKKVLIPAFIVFALAAFVIGTSSTIMQVYIGSLLAGISTGSYYGAAFSLSAKHTPKDKKSFSNAIINSGSALGMVIGLIGSSVLVGGFEIQWNYMLFITAIVIVAVTFVFVMFIKQDKTSDKEVAEEKKDAIQSTDIQNESLFSPKQLVVYFVYFATCYGYYMIVTWLPSFLVAEKGFAQGSVGYVAALVAVTAVPGALIFTKYIDKNAHLRLRLILFLLIAAAVTISLTVFAPNPAVLYIALILYGLLGKLAIDPVLITYVSDSVSGDRVARALTLFNFFGMSSSVIAPTLTGYIGDVTGSQVLAFYIATILLAAAALLFFLVVMLRQNKAVAN
ncbi:MFS transporter [Bacillus haynesii]|uniref:MFS transporter n=1 Tax=Bacillus haynesii TaxID=1925021 RepID=UPI001F4890ED|nr:MFS transporter [Bacillus haynesii]UIN47232.1 MFS transporter [Bacillus licheniformis]MCY8548904.1 MFS transporter [Bacillus haynesii]MCY8571505.1 MFS transporter [Bacillus haynesii]MCY8592556.1 MFS transporter [Bacillus haynesii]MCY9434464.1 MFS transporter [Bacillus haynesii]